MTVDIAKLRKLSAAAKDSVYGSRVADGYVAALCHAAPDLLDELERLRRFRDAVMASHKPREAWPVDEDGNGDWEKIERLHAKENADHRRYREAIDAERAVLAKESGNGV